MPRLKGRHPTWTSLWKSDCNTFGRQEKGSLVSECRWRPRQFPKHCSNASDHFPNWTIQRVLPQS